MQAQAYVSQVGSAGLSLGSAGFDHAAYTPPKINFIRDVNREGEVVIFLLERGVEQRPILRHPIVRGSGISGDGGIALRPRNFKSRARFGELGLRGLQRLVGYV